MKYCAMKEIDRMVRQLVKHQWLFSRGSKHGKLLPPNGLRAIVVPSTPSDKRAFLNFRRDIRQAGGAGIIL